MVHDTDIVELDLKSKRFQLSLKKKEALEQAEPQVGRVSVRLQRCALVFPAQPGRFVPHWLHWCLLLP